MLVAGVLASGLAGIIALGRTGIRLFWIPEDTIVPRLRLSEAAPVGALLLTCVALTVWAGPVIKYLDDTASYLDRPASYIEAVLSQSPARGLHKGEGL